MPKILVVEDEPHMRQNLATILEMEGYSVATAANGRQGVASAVQEPPDLVLCDVMMPELDGHGMLQQLREEPDLMDLPFIFLTAKGERADVRSGMNLGADDYLVKPVDRLELLATITSRLERNRLRKQHWTEQLAQQTSRFKPDFSSAKPLETLGLSPREAEVLLWLAQGKTNAEIGLILGTSELTVKTQIHKLYQKIGVENRNAAAVRALEVLNRQYGDG